jgi:hypothetical protein
MRSRLHGVRGSSVARAPTQAAIGNRAQRTDLGIYSPLVDLSVAALRWRDEGHVLLPAYLSSATLARVQHELPVLFPTAADFHTGAAASRMGPSQFANIVRFPFRIPELSLLAIDPSILLLARTFLGTEDVRLYRAETWAKYAGALEHDQQHHRDFQSHTPLVPSDNWRYRGLELFIWLHDVAEGNGPTQVVPLSATARLPVDQWGFSRQEWPELYDAELSTAGPAGTVAAFSTDTVHRATELTDRKGARFSLHLCFHNPEHLWFSRSVWSNRSFDPDLTPPAWERLVETASFEQLLFLGFPPKGHPFWTEEALLAMTVRYPRRSFAQWRPL